MVYYILYFYLPALWFRRAWGEDTLNSRKPQKFAEPGLRMCLLIMLIFALVTFFFARFNRYIAYGEAVVTVLLAIYALIRARARQKELQAFVENVTYNAESATNNTLIHFPLPMAVFRLNDSGVVWGNQPFWEMCGRTSPAFDAKLASLVPEFNSKWLLEGKNRMADLLEVDGKKYQVNGNMVRAGEREETYEFMGITYWVDVTEFCQVRDQFRGSRPVMAVLLLDNSAADVMRETYADMLVAIDDFDTAMLKPGLIAHVQGRRVLALDGFEAALTDKAAKQRMWAYIKQLTPAAAPL